MNRPRLFFTLSVIGMLLTFGVILKKKIPADEMTQFFTDGTLPPTLMPKPRPVRDVALEDTEEELEVVEPLKAVSENVGSWNSLIQETFAIPRLAEIPWERQEIEQAIRNFRAGECRLLPPDTEVFPFPENIGTTDEPVMSFRKAAVVVGLKMDARAQRLLPKASKSSIEGYLTNHTLVVQAGVFQNKQRQVTFAGPVQAALISKTSKGRTISPEPMIQDAVSNIRLLGVLADPEHPESTAARTLVLAFSYNREVASDLSTAAGTVKDYELLFLHLMADDYQIEAEPTLLAFGTTEGRMKFQELDISGSTHVSPNINAAIKFEEFRLMGLYPAKPTVTAVTCRARSTTPTEQVYLRLQGQSGLPPISMARYLDELHGAVVKIGRSN